MFPALDRKVPANFVSHLARLRKQDLDHEPVQAHRFQVAAVHHMVIASEGSSWFRRSQSWGPIRWTRCSESLKPGPPCQSATKERAWQKSMLG